MFQIYEEVDHRPVFKPKVEKKKSLKGTHALDPASKSYALKPMPRSIPEHPHESEPSHQSIRQFPSIHNTVNSYVDFLNSRKVESRLNQRKREENPPTERHQDEVKPIVYQFENVYRSSKVAIT